MMRAVATFGSGVLCLCTLMAGSAHGEPKPDNPVADVENDTIGAMVEDGYSTPAKPSVPNGFDGEAAPVADSKPIYQYRLTLACGSNRVRSIEGRH